jgi:RHS repeat-associated protein
VTWSVKEAGGGTVNTNGVYTTPATPGVFHVQAAGPVNSGLAAAATVTVPREVEIAPESLSLAPGQMQGFTATAVGFTDTRIAWSVQEAGGGTVDITGHYTAPATAGIYHVVATSMADPTKTAIATVQVATTRVTVAVSPNATQLVKGGTATFSAVVEGNSNTAVTWSATGGSINASTGAYTAPNLYGTFIITATSAADPNVKDEATVVVSGGSGSATLTYDLNGNLLSDGSRTFEWDAENRLVAVNSLATGHRSEFSYDGLGRRVEIVEKDNSVVSSDQKYLWDSVEIAEQRDSTGATAQKRFYGQGFVDTDGTVLTYTRDHLGSIRELVDAQQNVRARYDYDPYGRMTKVQGDRDSLFGYASMEWHAASGLELAVFRAYDPNMGRWISRDPINERGGINLYSYVNGDVIRLSDPLGFCFQTSGEVWLCKLTFLAELDRTIRQLDQLEARRRHAYQQEMNNIDTNIDNLEAEDKKGTNPTKGKGENNVNQAFDVIDTWIYEWERGYLKKVATERFTKDIVAYQRARERAWDQYQENIKQCKLCDKCNK